MHPNIAYAHGNASHEYIRPVLLLVPHADYPRYDAQEMENLVPIAYSNASISPLLNIHRVLEDKCTPVVGGQFRWVSVAFGYDVGYHHSYFQAEEGEK